MNVDSSADSTMASLENELIAMMAVLKRQQAALEEQHKVVMTAVSGFQEERIAMMKGVTDIREAAQNALEPLQGPLQEAVEAAATSAVKNSLQAEKKALGGAVNAAVREISGIKNAGMWPALIGGFVAGMLSCVVSIGFLVYLVKSGAIEQKIVLNSAAVAAAIKQELAPGPAPAAPGRRR
jgi:hypothetical protein